MDSDPARLWGVLSAPLQLVDIAEANVPHLVASLNTYERALHSYTPALRNAGGHPAFVVVGIVCINDFNDLIFDCIAGRGRSALRASRVVFEHLLNLYALDSDESRDRFMCHSLVGTEMAARWNPVESFLRGKDLKAARHRQKKLRRDNCSELNQALAEYGTSFLRQWHPQSLRDRAVKVGLQTEYEFFRSSSAAVHGSASSLEGSFWIVDGEPLVRVGPSVVACPAALAASVRFFSRFVALLESQVNLNGVSIRNEVDQIGTLIPEFCEYTNGLEEHLFASDGCHKPSIKPQRLDLRPGG